MIVNQRVMLLEYRFCMGNTVLVQYRTIGLLLMLEEATLTHKQGQPVKRGQPGVIFYFLVFLCFLRSLLGQVLFCSSS